MSLFIDVSKYQGAINWKRVASAGFKAAYLKASEGLTYADPDFVENRKKANAAGIRVGAYHFGDLYDAVLEAKHFVSVIENVGVHDLKPVLDLEENKQKLSAAALCKYARVFNRTVQLRTGTIPMFYSYAGFIEAMESNSPIGNGLWLAAYGRNDGKEHPVFAPKPWKKYQAHQFTSRGKVPGITGFVDVSDAPSGLYGLLAHPIKDKLSRL